MSDRQNPPASGAVILDGSTDWTAEAGRPARAMTIGTAGAVEVVYEGVTDDTDTVVIPANCLAVGVQHVRSIRKVVAAGTGASDILLEF